MPYIFLLFLFFIAGCSNSVTSDGSETTKAILNLSKPQSVKVNDQKAVELLNEGIKLINQNNLEKALQKFNDSIKESPRVGAYYFRGKIYESFGDKEKALEDYDWSIFYNDKNALAYFARGSLKWNYKDDEDALRDLRKADELLPNSSSVLSTLGLVLGTIGSEKKDLKMAMEGYDMLQKAKKIDPTFASAFNNSALIGINLSTLTMLPKFAIQAHEDILMALSLDPNNLKYIQVSKVTESLYELAKTMKAMEK